MRITTVCLGNICRSPIAEAVLRSELEAAGVEGVVVNSAGTSDWHEGEGADPRAEAALHRRGLKLEHRARQIRAEWFGDENPLRPDLVLAMDVDNLERLQTIAPSNLHDRIRLIRAYDPANDGVSIFQPAMSVPDPYYGGSADFDAVIDMLLAPSRALAATLHRRAEDLTR